MAQGFDIGALMDDPTMKIGISLLGASQQQNPWQAAMQNMQQMQAAQQQAAMFGMKKKQMEEDAAREAEEKMRRQAFFQQQQGQLTQAGPPSPAQQQQLTNLDAMQAGLNPQQIQMLQPPEPVDQTAQRRKQIVPIGGTAYLDLADGQVHQIPGASNQPGQQKMQSPLGKLIADREAQPAASPFRQAFDSEIAKRTAALDARAAGTKNPAASSAARIPMEIIRMDIGAENAEKALERFAEAIKDFDPRSTDQLNMSKRGQIEHIASEILGQAKEAVALGALQQADIELMERALLSPTSPKALLVGKDYIMTQVNESRRSFADRKATMRRRYPELANIGQESRQMQQQPQQQGRTIVREGVSRSTGKRVIEYSDGTREYAN